MYKNFDSNHGVAGFLVLPHDEQCPDEIVPDKSTSTTLRNTPLTYKHDSAGSFSITGNQLNRVYVRARNYAKLYWSTCSVLFCPDTVDEGAGVTSNLLLLAPAMLTRPCLYNFKIRSP
jgi:hypothetical protein